MPGNTPEQSIINTETSLMGQNSKFDVDEGDEVASVIGSSSNKQGSNQLAAIHQSQKKRVTWAEEAVVGVPNLADEIGRYSPGRILTNGPRLGLVVRRMPSFAVVYSKKYELLPLKRECFASNKDFEMVCKPGTWLRCNFAKVLDADGLVCKHMCVDVVESNVEPPLPTHFDEAFIRLKVDFDFLLLRAYDPSRSNLIVDSVIGDVLVPGATCRLLDLDESNPVLQSHWAVHIQKTHGCHWLLTPEKLFYELAQGCSKARRPDGDDVSGAYK